MMMDWTEGQIMQMRAGRPVYRNPDLGTSLSWLRTGEETDGEYGLMYVEYSAGAGVFPHYHTSYVETFHVFEGLVEGKVAGRPVRLEAGDETVAPKRAVHEFRISGDRMGRAIVELRPAHPGFEKWVVTLQNMTAAGLTTPDGRPKNLYHLALVLLESDIHLPGPGRVLMPAFRGLAALARRKGIDRHLEERYYRPS
ncbi:cupin domain-containing protein [Kocuria aegyptia]|uniref:Cupin type-2 domain-containing protein n=1 Tax=Kocuria aegyptia TaxID=330943 RepID=A0ABN2K4N7_9MICC